MQTYDERRDAEIAKIHDSEMAALRSLLTAAESREAEAKAEFARYMSPWTIEIRSSSGHWSEFCHDAPLTLASAEAREAEHKAENPAATFRVMPWFNINQRAERDAALKQVGELRAALTGASVRIVGLFNGYARKTYRESSNADTDLELALIDIRAALARSEAAQREGEKV